MRHLTIWLAQRRKAIIGVLVGSIAAQAARAGIDLTQAQADWLTVVLTGISVYLVPNQR